MSKPVNNEVEFMFPAFMAKSVSDILGYYIEENLDNMQDDIAITERVSDAVKVKTVIDEKLKRLDASRP